MVAMGIAFAYATYLVSLPSSMFSSSWFSFGYHVWVCRTCYCSDYMSFPVSKGSSKSEFMYFWNSK